MEDKVVFGVQLSNFSYVSAGRKKGSDVKKLRFTVVARFEHPERGELLMGWDGCLAHRNSDETLVWSPPLSRINPYKALKTGFLNEQMYDLVLEELAKSEYIADVGKEGWSEEDKNPRSANPGLPEFINCNV